MPDLPSSLALTSIADGSQIIASTHRANYLAVQTAVNALITALSGGSSGQVLAATDSDTIAWGNVGLAYRKVTEKDVVNTTTETDLLNGEITVAAGVMSTNKTLRVVLIGDHLNNSGAAVVTTFRIKLGGTEIWADSVSLSTNATRRALRIAFDIANLGAANSQFLGGEVAISDVTAATTGIGDIGIGWGSAFGGPIASNGTVAVDTAVAAALSVTVQHASAAATISTRLKAALVEVV